MVWCVWVDGIREDSIRHFETPVCTHQFDLVCFCIIPVLFCWVVFSGGRGGGYDTPPCDDLICWTWVHLSIAPLMYLDTRCKDSTWTGPQMQRRGWDEDTLFCIWLSSGCLVCGESFHNRFFSFFPRYSQVLHLFMLPRECGSRLSILSVRDSNE